MIVGIKHIYAIRRYTNRDIDRTDGYILPDRSSNDNRGTAFFPPCIDVLSLDPGRQVIDN